MKKLHFIAIVISAIMLTLFSTTATAQQQRTLILKQGNWTTPGDNPLGANRCDCGTAQYDCICGILNYSSITDMNVPSGQISVVVSSPVITDNSLQIKFKERLRMELKTNDFVQKDSVEISSDVAKSLGYKSITILPGNYTIKDDNSLSFNIERGDPYQTRGWGLIGFVVAVIILVSIIAGQSSAPSGSTGSQNCDECRRDMAWYSGLKWYKKIAFHAWYITRWTICKASGCI